MCGNWYSLHPFPLQARSTYEISPLTSYAVTRNWLLITFLTGGCFKRTNSPAETNRGTKRGTKRGTRRGTRQRRGTTRGENKKKEEHAWATCARAKPDGHGKDLENASLSFLARLVWTRLFAPRVCACSSMTWFVSPLWHLWNVGATLYF